MLFRDPTVRTSNYCFGVGNDAMNPWEKFSCNFRISKNNFVMRHIPISCRSSIGSPSIRSNHLQKVLTLLGSCSASQSIQKVLNAFY